MVIMLPSKFTPNMHLSLNANATFRFPGSCPYVTSVGATQLSDAGGLPEVAAVWQGNYGEQVGSSGGFSNVFAAPSYQQSALASYWASGGAPDDSNGPWTNINPDGYPRYNNSQTTRGQPDIAANGKNWDLFWGGGEGFSWGTS
jgi:tripeptidyl-peptidase-1